MGAAPVWPVGRDHAALPLSHERPPGRIRTVAGAVREQPAPAAGRPLLHERATARRGPARSAAYSTGSRVRPGMGTGAGRGAGGATSPPEMISFIASSTESVIGTTSRRGTMRK